MPYSKKRSMFRKGRRVLRRRRPIRKPRSTSNVADTAFNIAKYAVKGFKFIKGLINVEKHKFDTTFATTVGSTPAVTNLVAIPQGDGEGSRTGNSLLTKYAYITLNMVRSSSSTAVSDTVRVVVVVDKEQSGDTAPPYNGVFESNDPLALINKLNVGRFSILYDKFYNLTANTPAIQIKEMVPLNMHVRYNGSASTDIEKSGIYLMWVGSNGTNQVSFNGFVRLAYYDN